ncbi:MAG: AAA family ATPase [Oscillospiraceae bacterium]|nr:AAA family ATPase [Oscillospiraceae bacterium]
MDRKDEILMQQLEVIRTLTENNMRSMSSDFWGRPVSPRPAAKSGEHSAGAAPSAPQKHTPPAADSSGQGAPAEQEEPLPPPEKLEDLLSELDSYIGLASVKEEVHNLINMVQVYKLRREHGLPTTDMSLHMVFTGNPGTGKTMMARMMARIYRSLEILSKGQLVEVDRSGLVAGYVGQTALKTQKVIEKAMGGVLFVDEAYALNGKSENDFGQEAIDTLLKAMEDHRDDLVVIVAGYTDLMDRFIHSNPGLESRFNRFLEFADYTPDEMLKIFHMQCKKGCYQLAEGTEELVRDYITEENGNPETFGNARGVRNIFESILVQQNNRLAAAETVTRDDLMTITPDDVLHARGKLD